MLGHFFSVEFQQHHTTFSCKKADRIIANKHLDETRSVSARLEQGSLNLLYCVEAAQFYMDIKSHLIKDNSISHL